MINLTVTISAETQGGLIGQMHHALNHLLRDELFNLTPGESITLDIKAKTLGHMTITRRFEEKKTKEIGRGTFITHCDNCGREHMVGRKCEDGGRHSTLEANHDAD